MNICFVSTFFTGATLPFIKHLNDNGQRANFYLFARQGQRRLETLTFDTTVKGSAIIEIKKDNPIYGYLNKSVNIRIVPYYLRTKKKTLRDYLSYIENMGIVHNLTKRIEKESYDIVYVIVNEKLDYLLCKRLKAKGHKNIIIAYHEVIKNHIEEPILKDVVKKTANYGYPIITHSEHTKKTLINLTTDIKNIKTIYFGSFETFKLYDSDIPLINKDYILYIGIISPYKGLSFLYKTMEQYGDNADYKIVVAGAGRDSVLTKMKKDPRYIVINRFLTDSEFVNLVKFAKCVILPYVAGSQSGVPQVTMLFNTPVIATKVGAFPEIIKDGYNGILIDYGSKEQLISAVNKIFERERNNDFDIPEHLKWDNIVNVFLHSYVL